MIAYFTIFRGFVKPENSFRSSLQTATNKFFWLFWLLVSQIITCCRFPKSVGLNSENHNPSSSWVSGLLKQAMTHAEVLNRTLAIAFE